MNPEDEEQILKLFEDGDQALMSADITELHRIYAEDYWQSDESGRLTSRQDLIRNLSSGAIRFLSMTSTGRRIRFLTDDLAVVHGSEEDEVERDGTRGTVRYVYMDVVGKRNGSWLIVATQLAKPSSEN